MFKEKKIKIGKTGCTIPSPLAFSYALCIANSGKAKNLLLAGFDGFNSEDIRHQEMENTIEIYFKLKRSIDFKGHNSYKI